MVESQQVVKKTDYWSVSSHLQVGLPIQVSYQTDDGNSASDEVAPVEYLLASVASCLAKSYRIVFQARGMEESSLKVTVGGKKADDRPNRLSDIKVDVDFYALKSMDMIERVTRDVRRLCTVSNTLEKGVEISVNTKIL